MSNAPVTHYLTNREGFWRILCQRAVGAWRTANRTVDWNQVTCSKCLAKQPTHKGETK